MKLAKKVLAIVMALGLIACMSAMAFASNSFSVEAYKTNGDKQLKVTVYADGYVGLASGTVNVTYSGATFSYADEGEQASLVNSAKGNSFTGETNDTVPGKVTYGFFFKENLWDAGTFKAAGKDGPLDINVAKFDIVTFVFDLPAKGEEYSVSVTVNGQDIYGGSGSGAGNFSDFVGGTFIEKESTTIKEVKEIPTNAKPEEKDEYGRPIADATTEAAATATDATTVAAAEDANAAKTNNGAKVAVKTDGGKNTGDNGVIAVVAGVIALAGAAFVVTKKRK